VARYNLLTTSWKGVFGQTVTVAAPQPVVPQEAQTNAFIVGDSVMLKPNDNPYKGCLKCGEIYQVTHSCYGEVRLVADNGSNGYFKAKFFELYSPGPSAHIDAGAEEYEEAMQAQEIMEGRNQ